MTLPPSQTTLILQAGRSLETLLVKLRPLAGSPGPLLVVCDSDQEGWVRMAVKDAGLEKAKVARGHSLGDLAPEVLTPLFTFLPEAAPSLPAMLPEESSGSARPWVPLVEDLRGQGPRLSLQVFGWTAPVIWLKGAAARRGFPSLRDLEVMARQEGFALSYASAPALAASRTPSAGVSAPRLTSAAKVLALIPHFQCEEWLEGALRSLVEQSRPLDGILVLDDASSKPPRDLVEKFPSVTLWRADQRRGPYGLIQSAIEKTGYDAYLFQDADDWSSVDRLELLLEAAERTGAELIGTQELMYLREIVFPNQYPVKVREALSRSPHYALLHPSSLVARGLVARLGGYASGLPFSGDMEFLLRAFWATEIVNLDRYCYFRRVRMNSLITSTQTGLGSPARTELDNRIKARFRENQERQARGLPPDLSPLEKAPPAVFESICGPDLMTTL